MKFRVFLLFSTVFGKYCTLAFLIYLPIFVTYLFQKSQPYVVILEPGQTLYVPQHWWHYVECLEPAVSVNVWVPLVNF